MNSSLPPALERDGQNSSREQCGWLLACIEEAARLASPHDFAQPNELCSADGKVLASCRACMTRSRS